ncbi:MAG: 7-carboxy-7-deazaguanine synthase QueE [Syntrophomonas sp.]
MKANFAEIMESIQGEGLLLGSKQVFLRFTGCNLRCSYCDTPASREHMPTGRLFIKTGSRQEAEIFTNPLSAEQVHSYITDRFSSSWISLTGGEPLLWTDFIKELALTFKNSGYKFLLETNGTLGEQLSECLPFIDMISMDIKLPSATASDCWDLHHSFLLKAREKPCYIKVVVTADTTFQEIKQAASLVKSVGAGIPLILQPVTCKSNCGCVPIDKLLAMQKLVLEELNDVRIIPQLHPLMGLI